MMKSEAVWRAVETWSRKEIDPVLAAAEDDPELKRQLEQRYGELLLLAEVDLKDLAKVPAKLATKRALVKAWDPDAAAAQILATLPMKPLIFRAFRGLRSLPGWVGYLGRLEALELECCEIDAFPGSMSRLVSLKKLSIVSSRLSELPESLAQLELLEEVELSSNLLVNLPSIDRWARVRVLRLASNKLAALPESLGALTQLEELSAGWNKITEIPPSIGRLQKLRVLDLRSNDLSGFPKELAQLTSLETLLLLSPSLQLPAWVVSLPSLTQLGLQFVCHVPVPESPTKLTSIDLSYAKIESIPELVLQSPDLQILDLSDSKVKSLSAGLLQLERLAFLDITDTPLGYNLKITAPVEGVAAVKELVKLALAYTEAFVEPSKLYAQLESRDLAQIREALAYLATCPDARAAAERRYGHFIRVRLGDPEATLEDLERAALSEEEVALLVGPERFGRHGLSFARLRGPECRLIVDVIGAVMKTYVNVDAHLNSAASMTSNKRLLEWLGNEHYRLRSAIAYQASQYAEGWFGRVLAVWNGADVGAIRFDHTDFSQANDSPVLREFMVYVAAFGYNISFDIFQSTVPDLTPVFWVTRAVPTTVWGDTQPSFPKSVLAFERKARFRKGDEGAFSFQSSLTAGC